MTNLINITKNGTKSYPASFHLVDMLKQENMACCEFFFVIAYVDITVTVFSLMRGTKKSVCTITLPLII